MDKQVTARSRRRLMIEALVSAGPRKSPEEYRDGARELCEDCAGYMSYGDIIVFWICDGMSDSHEIPKRNSHPGFNSRILAQDLGEGFARVMAEALVKPTTCGTWLDLQSTLFTEIAENWEKKLIEYITDFGNTGSVDQFIDAMPEMADGSYRMEWSSTLLGGVYNEKEQTLDIVNVGNGGAVVIGEESTQVTPKTSSLALIAMVSRAADVKVYPVEVDTKWEHFEEVTYFVAMSDGVSCDMKSLLRELYDLKNVSRSQLRRRLLTRGELSYDDQAVIIGQLMPEWGTIASGSDTTG